jgi:hypothetical protein
MFVKHLWSLLQFSRSHQAVCVTFTKLVITPSSEVQKMSRLLLMKLKFQNFPTMYTMQNDLSKFGLHVAVKLNNVDLPLFNITLHF